MRILVVSFRFPPYNSVGGVSVGKTVKYLVGLGHDVRVISARDQQVPRTLPMEVDAQIVVATGWWNPLKAAELAAGGSERVATAGFSAGRRYERFAHRAGQFYRGMMIPDKEIGWGPAAFRAGRRIVKEWRPDIIYASAPPFTSLLAGSLLASRTRIPWVAGLRDLWSDNPHRHIRLARFDRALESWVLKSAAGAVVTTEEAEEVVRARFPFSTETVMNGIDMDDVRERTSESSPKELRIVYTGVLIHDRRDPTALFQAMRTINAEGGTIRADFYGRDSAIATKAAKRVGVGDLVFAHGPIPYEDSLQAQRNADLLLLLQWDHPGERIICPAKVFEYAAARRPVLGIGPANGVVARLLEKFGMGRVLQSPNDIAEELRRLMDSKARMGGIRDVSPSPPSELSRYKQVEKLACFLSGVARSPRSPARRGPLTRGTSSMKETRFSEDA